MGNTQRTPESACVELGRAAGAVVDRHRVRSADASGGLGRNGPLGRRIALGLIAALAACGGGLPDDEDGSRADAGGDPNVSANWGFLASPGREGDRIVATLFFAGEARDGSQRYEYESISNMELYTETPSDARYLHWSSEPATRIMALDDMVETGVNVIYLSSWGPRGTQAWAQWAPMQTSTFAHDELLSAIGTRPLQIVPFLESTPEWRFRNDFTGISTDPAPGLVLGIVDLVNRILVSPEDPAWRDRWAMMYGRDGTPRYPVAIIQASSDSPMDDEAYVDGLDAVAAKVEAETGMKIGFLLDPMVPDTTADGQFFATPEGTAGPMSRSESVLAVSPFLPEVWKKFGADTEDQNRLLWKRRFISAWAETPVPTLVDVSPGYDASIVFPSAETFGMTASWRNALIQHVEDFGEHGIVLNSWNGFTEAMSMIPTLENDDAVYRWAADIVSRVASD
jgi:hypothetical protein